MNPTAALLVALLVPIAIILLGLVPFVGNGKALGGIAAVLGVLAALLVIINSAG